MIKIENTEVFGFNAALRAMRNPKDSWDKSDSQPGDYWSGVSAENTIIGPNDLKLLTNLTAAGSEHRKVLRFIKVWVTMTLPRYVLTELDTYKVGCDRMSCSTMHKLGHTELTNDDFQLPPLPAVLDYLNDLGKKYREGDKKDYSLVKLMKANLPESFLQRSDFCMNYETCLNIFRQRKDHRLDEWKFISVLYNTSICNWIFSLPYMSELLKAAGLVKSVELSTARAFGKLS